MPRIATTIMSSTREKRRLRGLWVRLRRYRLFFNIGIISVHNHGAQCDRTRKQNGAVLRPACGNDLGRTGPRGDRQQAAHRAKLGNVPADFVKVAAAGLIQHGVSGSDGSGKNGGWRGPIDLTDLGGGW